nr:fiber-2 [Tawny frogmouth aviadenovirus A]
MAKRGADAIDLDPASLRAKRSRLQTSDDEPAPRDNPTVDLVYPFDYNIDFPDINPPFLKPGGPLFTDNMGQLNLRVTQPIVIENSAVGLKHNATLEVDNTGALGLAVDGEGPIVIGEDGLELKYDNSTLEVDVDWELAVKLDPQGGLSASPQGIKVNVDDTLLIAESDSTPTTYELGVHLNPDGPITADASGLDLEIDDTYFKLTNNEQQQKQLSFNDSIIPEPDPSGPITETQKKLNLNYDTKSLELQTTDSKHSLAVRLDSTGPIQSSDSGLTLQLNTNGGLENSSGLGVKVSAPIQTNSSGLGLNIDNATLEVSNGQLKVKGGSGLVSVDNKTIKYNGSQQLSVNLNSQTPIVADNSGVKLLYNSDDFYEDVSKGLSLFTPGKYLSPYCVMEIGSKNLDNYEKYKVQAESKKLWRCNVYACLANSGGIVNGIITLLINKNQITDLGTGTSGGINFTFVLNPSDNGETTYCYVESPTTIPAEEKNKILSIMTPIPPPSSIGVFNGIPAKSTNDWYKGAKPIGTIVSFRPMGTGMTWNQSTVTYSQATPLPASSRASSSLPDVMVFNYGCFSTDNWFNSPNEKTMFTGPIPFSYWGTLPSFTRTGSGARRAKAPSTSTPTPPTPLPSQPPTEEEDDMLVPLPEPSSPPRQPICAVRGDNYQPPENCDPSLPGSVTILSDPSTSPMVREEDSYSETVNTD